MRTALLHLANACHGDDRPDCPILEGISHGDTDIGRSTDEGAAKDSARERTS
jgi:hypothetical protein